MLFTGTGKPRAGDFELWSWLFMRISGIVLVLLVLIHLAIMHVSQPIQNITFSFVEGRWAVPAWRWYDLGMLGLALLHGLNGARVVSDDLVHSRGWRLATMSILWMAAFVFLIVGAQIILSFQTGAFQ